MKRAPMPGRTTPLRRVGWPREHHDPALPKHGPSLAARSPKRARQMGIYRHLRLLFLADRPWCESPWPCGRRATEVQHRRGRRGERLLDQRWWASSCHDCNMRAETQTGEALRTNWLVPEDFAGDPSEKPIIPIPIGATA